MARKRTSQPKDFIAVKGRMSLQITPQTARGWRYLGIWSLILMSPVIPFGLLASAVDDTPNEHWALWAMIPLFLIMALLIWRMVQWMLPRSEVIDIKDVAQWKRDKAAKGE